MDQRNGSEEWIKDLNKTPELRFGPCRRAVGDCRLKHFGEGSMNMFASLFARFASLFAQARRLSSFDDLPQGWDLPLGSPGGR